jgi:outer membrane protein OmpA-like peptidoglycan-associated protein
VSQASRRGAIVVAAAALLLQGCPSAYQRTYEQTTQQLESQQQAMQMQEQAAHAEASKYAAVVYFPTGSATIGDDGQRELGWFVRQMQPYPKAVILVQGFADATGAEATNEGLSQQRATSVAGFLQAQGIDPYRIVVEGFGEQHAAAPNETARGRRDNRRVEVTVR